MSLRSSSLPMCSCILLGGGCPSCPSILRMHEPLTHEHSPRFVFSMRFRRMMSGDPPKRSTTKIKFKLAVYSAVSPCQVRKRRAHFCFQVLQCKSKLLRLLPRRQPEFGKGAIPFPDGSSLLRSRSLLKILGSDRQRAKEALETLLAQDLCRAQWRSAAEWEA